MANIKAKKVYIFENSGCIRRKLDAKKISVYLSLTLCKREIPKL
jgi:hypothetical protein